MQNARNKKGFTLLEILLVVAAIGILAGIVILAINPSKQLGDTRNAQRRADVSTILNAVYQYALDNNGNLPSAITVVDTFICKSGGDCTTPNPDYIDLDATLTLDEKYLTAIPTDPSSSDADTVRYKIKKTGNNRVTVSAPDAEQGATISATK
jgi:type IV pilus assembly protein PilA